MYLRTLMIALWLMLICSPAIQAAQKPDDRETFDGLKTAKIIFDVRVAGLEKLEFNLRLLDETLEGIVCVQGIKPDMIVAFREPGVKLLNAAALNEETIALFK